MAVDTARAAPCQANSVTSPTIRRCESMANEISSSRDASRLTTCRWKASAIMFRVLRPMLESNRASSQASSRKWSTKGDAAIEAIRALTKEPEVGDQYTGRVVKTTDFGAFVELKKGTDGLLHVSNVGPGRVNHIADVLTRGDTLDVLVQEVDKERGRIGLKLIAKHENGELV